MSGFFSLVSQYAGSSDMQPRENRLTNNFAGTLMHADGLALVLARSWLASENSSEAWYEAGRRLDQPGLLLRGVRPQRPCGVGRHVDLELTFGVAGDSAAQDTVLWVEVKHGADPHEQQLDNYLDDLERLGVHAGAVVLLAPRGSYPFDPEPPAECPQRTWQQSASDIVGWLAGALDPVGRFLATELLDYLRKERLMDPTVITPFQLAAIAESDRAHEAVAFGCKLAAERIETGWAKAEPRYEVRGAPHWGVGYWEVHPASPSGQPEDWGDLWFDWSLRSSDEGLVVDPRNAPVFVCSATGESPVAPGPEGAAWTASLPSTLQFHSVRDKYCRVLRFAYPEEVLVGRNIETQALRLADWVLETYRALRDAGPPPGVANSH